jgi:hypothetical protein
MVVVVGDTVAVPLADVDVKLPGMIAMLVAAVAANANVLLEPDAMLAGLAVNEVIAGGGVVTVTVAVAWTEPAELVAVSV